MEVNGWQVLQSYPPAPLGSGNHLKWFGHVLPGGTFVDQWTHVETGGLYFELL